MVLDPGQVLAFAIVFLIILIVSWPSAILVLFFEAVGFYICHVRDPFAIMALAVCVVILHNLSK